MPNGFRGDHAATYLNKTHELHAQAASAASETADGAPAGPRVIPLPFGPDTAHSGSHATGHGSAANIVSGQGEYGAYAKHVTEGIETETLHAYNGRNQLTRTEESGNVTEYGYDRRGNLVKETLNGKLRISYEYDVTNMMEKAHDPALGSAAYTYNGFRNPANHASIIVFATSESDFFNNSYFAGNYFGDSRQVRYMTFGGEASSRNIFNWGHVVSINNRVSDLDISRKTAMLPFDSTDEIVSRLLENSRTFQNNQAHWNLIYAPGVTNLLNTFNSNSFAHGLLRSVGVTEIPEVSNAPG